MSRVPVMVFRPLPFVAVLSASHLTAGCGPSAPNGDAGSTTGRPGTTSSADGGSTITATASSAPPDGDDTTGEPPTLCNPSAQVHGAELWRLQLGSDSHRSWSDIAVGPSGAIAVAGQAYVDDDTRFDGWVAAISPEGALLWDWTLASPEDDQATAVAFADDGDLLSVGADVIVVDPAMGVYHTEVWIARHSAEGALEWTAGAPHEAPTSEGVVGVGRGADGEILVLTGLPEVREAADHLTVRTFSADGALLSTVPLDLGGRLDPFAAHAAWDAEPATGGSFVVAAFMMNGWIGRWSSSLELLWSYAGFEWKSSSWIHRVVEDDAGAIVISFPHTPDDETIPILSHIDGAGQLQAQHAWADAADSDYVRDVLMDFDGDLIMVGDHGPVSETWVRKYTVEGELLWEAIPEHGDADLTLVALALTEDCSILAAGSIWAEGGQTESIVLSLSP